MPEEDRRSYIVVRPDGLAVHTAPVTEDEAWWLWYAAYRTIEGRALRARYLEEYGNVLDLQDYVERLRRLGVTYVEIYRGLTGFFKGPEELRERVDAVFSERTFRGLKRLPEARRIVEELVGSLREFARGPARPRPIASPARYLELHRHLQLDLDGVVRGVEPQPEWHAYKDLCCRDYYGISVFGSSFWLWLQSGYTYAIAVRRDAADEDVIAALASDGVALGFLAVNARHFRHVINEYEGEMRSAGYGDVVERAKFVLAAVELLGVGRHSEEEALPA